MTSMDEIYLHGTTPAEHARLGRMNRLLNAPNLAFLELGDGERVLEVGAGTGVFASELARAVGPQGSVVAIERDAAQLSQAREHAAGLPQLDLRQGDAYEPPLDDEWGSFDLVHARFLLEHLRRPLDCVRQLVRAARDGGRIVLVDDDHSLFRLWPEPAGILDLWRAYTRQFERLGSDPWIGRKLATLLRQAGARPTRSGWISFGACATEEGFPDLVDNMAEVIEGAASRIAEEPAWNAARIAQTLADFRSWGEREDAHLGYPLPCVMALK